MILRGRLVGRLGRARQTRAGVARWQSTSVAPPSVQLKSNVRGRGASITSGAPHSAFARNLPYESSTARRPIDFRTRVPLPPTRRRWLRDDGAFRTKQTGIHMSQSDPTEPVVEQAPTEQAPAATEQAPVEQASEEQQQVAATGPEPAAASPEADTTVGSDPPATEA